MYVRAVCACALVMAFTALVESADAQAREITAEQAIRRALEQHPDIRVAQAEVEVAQGQLATARALSYNPEVTAALGSASNPDTSLTTYEIELSQRLELGGKRGARTTAARRRIEAAEARLARTRALVGARALRAFALASLGRARVASAQEAEEVANQLRGAATERLALGAGTQLEVNIAAAGVGRDRRTRLEAERAYASALLELAAAVGLPATQTVSPSGEPPAVPVVEKSEEQLVQLAVSRRQDLVAARAERAAGEAELRFARALAWPDPALGVSAGRDDFESVRFTISLPLPLWNRGQGERTTARAALARAELAEFTVRRQVELEVRDAYQAYQRAREAEAGFDRETVTNLTENLTLAGESFRAGKIGLLVFSAVRRDLVEARLAYLDTLADLAERRYALEIAVGGTVE
ncbi:MAG: TolC family protein [Gemmatimonadales bacterium]